MINAFTVDVEDYFQVSAFDPVVDRGAWATYPSRVVGNTQRLLALLRQHQVHGTFFLLGWIAERFPRLVRQIRDDGHELASHSYWHRLVYDLTPAEFREDLRRSRAVIEDASGQRVTGYRAPSFSITARSLWAFEVLADEGFQCDSSVFPIRHDRYGIPGADRFLHRRVTSSGDLWELPGSTVELGRLRLPAAGGGYFRLYPWQLSRRMLGSINRAGRPFVFYTHPWEIDPAQPRIPGVDRRSRFRHYTNLRTTEQKLERLLATFRFGRISDVIREATEPMEAATTD